jgi:hypothetical protein
VAITLNECAGFWRRIHAASEPKLWKGADLQPHWADTRAEWLEAADVAMAEALILADSSINERAPRARAEELIEDILDTYVFSKRSQQEQHLPPAFVPLRTLAEKLATLASEVEGAQTALSAAPLAPPPTPIEAGRRLDQVLGNLRSIRQAEEELQQDIRS